jgi:hypothetical protein
MPRTRARRAQPGDRIIALGGRTGRDGIHGATFSSAPSSPTPTPTSSPTPCRSATRSTEKRCSTPSSGATTSIERLPVHRDHRLRRRRVQQRRRRDGRRARRDVHLERRRSSTTASPTPRSGSAKRRSAWCSRCRPPTSTPSARASATRRMSSCDLGTFGTTGRELILNHGDRGRPPVDGFLHDGIPTNRCARPSGSAARRQAADTPSFARPTSPQSCPAHDLLAHPNIASKHWIIRQYDHEVQGGTVVKPLVGPLTATARRCRGDRAGARHRAAASPSPAAWRPAIR